MQAVCDTLEQLVSEGGLKQYAIGGATAAAAPPYGGQRGGPGRIRPTLVSSPRLPPRPPRLRVSLHPKEENRDH
jgi:hypothetical protein